MSYEWVEMQREADRHAAIEQYLRNNLAKDVYGSPRSAIGLAASPGAGSPRMGHPLPPDPRMAAPLGVGSVYAASPPPMAVHTQPLTMADKIRTTFADLDYNKNGVVDQEEFVRGMAEVKLTFTEPTSIDLYQKAKAGKSGDMNEPEWFHFISKYPMLLDALYHRFRSIKNADHEAELAKAAAERLAEREAQVRKEEDAAREALEAAKKKAADEEEAMAAAEARAKESESEHRRAVDAVGEAFRERQDKERKIAAEWEATRSQRIAAAEAARDADVATRRLAAAEERETWALQALEAARKEKEQAQADLEAAKQRQESVKPAGEDPETVLTEADRKVEEAQRKEYELGAAAAEDAARADRARWARDEQDRVKAGAEARLNRATDVLTEAEKATEDNNKRLTDAETVKDTGIIIDEKENLLVEQEVRLKEQRESLEEKENTLQRECHEYTRASPARDSPYTPTK